MGPFPLWSIGCPHFWVLIFHVPLKCHVPQAGGPTSPGPSAHRETGLSVLSPTLPLAGKLQKVWTAGSWTQGDGEEGTRSGAQSVSSKF